MLLLIFCTGVYAGNDPKNTPNEIVLLNEAQKKVLYEFAVLQNNGVDGELYWLKHKSEFPAFDNHVRDALAKEIFMNSQLLYIPAKNSSIELWMQAQSLTSWMLYLATFIAVCAVIALMRNYWGLIIKILIRQFQPLFKVLFSEVLLTYELLLIGVACVFMTCKVDDMVLRTVLAHLGIFLVWSQSTALFTKEYLVKGYIHEIRDNFWENNKWKVIKTICFPAIIVTFAILFILYKVPQDKLYYYEVVITSLVAVYALPIWRPFEKYIYPVLIPYKDPRIERSIYSLATCTVLVLLVDAVFLYQSSEVLSYFITALTSLLTASFLILSLKVNYKHNYKNYIYLQFVTVLFLLSVLICSFYIQSVEMIWVGLIGLCVFVIVKYWEVVMHYFSWNRRAGKWAWSYLGMAVLLWLLAKGILFLLNCYYI